MSVLRILTYRPSDLKIDKGIVGGVMLFFLGIALGAFLFAGDSPFIRDVTGYWTNVVTEMLGVAVTVLILDQITNRRRSEDLKKMLVRKAGSQSNDIALNAVEELRHYGWLAGEDGLLKKEYLYKAQMQGADLRDTNLAGALLEEANLTGANLEGANLTEAWFGYANLQSASLRKATLQRVYLGYANLQEASLWQANLQGADLLFANLTWAGLGEANLTDVRLPNGEIYSKDTDMGKFTNKDHPEYAQILEQINVHRQGQGLPPLA